MRDAKHRDLVAVQTRWAVCLGDLQQALLEDEPTVVHFSGHGSGADGIVLHATDQPENSLVTADALAGLFRVLKDDIRVVVLNACYSDMQAQAIVKEIHFVIRVSDSIGDVDALKWLAAMCSHVPNKGEQTVRYYGLLQQCKSGPPQESSDR